MIEVKVIADTSFGSSRITSLQLTYPRFILAQLNTHRMFSRSTASSRAIPTTKLIEQVRNTPVFPIHWGKNQAGMQAESEVNQLMKNLAQRDWQGAAQAAANHAQQLHEFGVHKQVVNRLLEPFLLAHTIVTATDWDNFFALRLHHAAQPEMQALAQAMYDAISGSQPKERYFHLPYISEDEIKAFQNRFSAVPDRVFQYFAPISTARCARVSYLKHDNTQPTTQEDIRLYRKLMGSEPRHASPAEHPARAVGFQKYHRNFKGWQQWREIVELSAQEDEYEE